MNGWPRFSTFGHVGHVFIYLFTFDFRGESYGVGHNHWFLFVVVTSFIITLLWCFFYLLQLKEAINITLPFSWLKLVKSKSTHKKYFVWSIRYIYIAGILLYCYCNIFVLHCFHCIIVWFWLLCWPATKMWCQSGSWGKKKLQYFSKYQYFNSNISFQVFGIFNTIAYGFGAYILHNDYKATPPELQWKLKS